ncbi:SusC/RagA family TonB-linked outer membrane protein [Pedobacter immunditicola]|uniref:SusC/RagA family TonB-linked outer membrane protein n=1 Tax=Pedobacter immunditicola TaxID=3133440 RepID=UPI0030ACF2C1
MVLGNIRKKILTTLILSFGISTLYASAGFEPSPSQPIQTTLNDIRVSGRVTDDQDMSLPGVSVKLKGTTIGTSTDLNGNYVLSVPDNGVLVFSYTGFTAKEIQINKQSKINVKLSVDNKVLNEVIVVGYGTQSKKGITGAVASIGYDKFKDRSYSNVVQSLAGQVAGVNISQGQGAPGVAPIIRIRGVSSLTAGTNPLFVVDGVPLENFNLNLINSQDIASVEVLKDASSAAIYGSRGASGVILVTTKLGKAGKTAIDVNAEYGVQEVMNKVDMMDAQQWIQYYITAKNNSWTASGAGRSATDPNSVRGNASTYKIPEEFITNPAQFGNGTDWQDVMFRIAPMKSMQMSASGGTEKTQFLFSGSILDQDAVLDNNYYKRLAVRSNIKHLVSDKITLGFNLSFTGIQDRTDGTQGKSDVIGLALQSDPIFPLYNENGNLGIADPNSVWNRYLQYNPVNLWHPYATTRFTDKQNKAFNTLGIGYAEYKILQNLKLRTSINGNLGNNRYDYYQYKNQGYGYNQSLSPATGTASSGYMLNWLNENTLTYDAKIKNHSFNILTGFTVQKQHDEFQSATATNYPNDLVHTLNAGTVTSGTSTLTEWSMISYLARLNYNFKDRYFLTSTIRRDGSSRFGSNNKWGYFPSVSAGWIVSDEHFMANLKAVSLLKLRASYGIAGNNQIPNYGSSSLLRQGNYALGNTLSSGLITINLNNADLKWEKTTQLNLGLDLGLIKNRINISAEYYRSITNDMLLNVPIPDISGFGTQLTNIGKMKNSGFEFNLNTKNLIGGFKWSTDFNFSHNKNEVLQLGPNNAPIYFTDNETMVKTEVGQPISNFFGYQFDGVYKNQTEINNSVRESSTVPGDPIIRDVNGDGKITTDDRTVIGNYQPKFTAGIVNTFSYKGIELSFMFQGSYGGEIVNQNYRFLGFWNSGRNLYAKVNNYYKSESEPGDGINPRPTMERKAFQSAFSTLWVEDASYLRLKNINLSFALPQRILQKTPVKSLRLYVNADNVYLFSKYTGYDPENTTFSATSYSSNGTAANAGTVSSAVPPGAMIGLDYGSYPVPRVITAGLKASF